ncbi:MAG: insulinase family protein [Planctomycetes bacterium]|nr:insulinase family protein [Planctomycetota bacterium]
MALLDRAPQILHPAPDLELLYLPEPRFKRALLQLHFDQPLADGSSPARTLLCRVLEQGTRGLPTQMHLTRREEQLYGASVGVDGERLSEVHRVHLSLAWVGERFLPAGSDVEEGILGLGRELLEDPCRDPGGSFPEATVVRERDQLVRRIRSLQDDRDSYARERFVAEMCAGEPFGTPPWGTEEQVLELGSESLEDARSGMLDGASLSALLVGPVLPQRAMEQLSEWFGAGGVRGGGPRPLPPAPLLKRPRELREVREELAVDQARFQFGFRFQPPEDAAAFEALSLASSILGGGSHGRLFRIVREERSLCYGIYSTVRTRKGILAVGAGIDAGSYEEVRDEVLKQVAVVAAGGWREEEEHAARASVLNRLDSLGDSPGAVAQFIERERLLGFRRSPARRAQDLSAVTREQIAAAAAGWQPDLVYLLAGAAAPAEVAS